MTGSTRAWGWVRHLLEGGTTPWGQWSEPAGPAGRVVPGAQQLEVLRRVNVTAQERGLTVPRELVKRVVYASAAGRGRPDLQLAGAVVPSRFGAAPVDPVDLSADELMRVALHLLAQDLVAARDQAAVASQVASARIARPWRRRYRLVGDPWLVGHLRPALAASGHPEHPGGHVVVLGADVPTMLADAWTNNCFSRPIGDWDEWLTQWRQHGGLPPGADLGAMVRWGERESDRGVHLVVDPSGRRLRRLVGVRGVATPARPSHVAAELARRLVPVLGLTLHGDARGEVLRTALLPRLPVDHMDAGLPGVPEQHQRWVGRRARRLQERLEEAGYPVAGDLASYGRPTHGDAHADPDDVLTLAVRLLLGAGDSGREGGRSRGQENAT